MLPWQLQKVLPHKRSIVLTKNLRSATLRATASSLKTLGTDTAIPATIEAKMYSTRRYAARQIDLRTCIESEDDQCREDGKTDGTSTVFRVTRSTHTHTHTVDTHLIERAIPLDNLVIPLSYWPHGPLGDS